MTDGGDIVFRKIDWYLFCTPVNLVFPLQNFFSKPPLYLSIGISIDYYLLMAIKDVIKT